MSVDLTTDRPMESVPHWEGFAIIAGVAVVAAPPALDSLAGTYLLVAVYLAWRALRNG